jgi:hypothetical protein
MATRYRTTVGGLAPTRRQLAARRSEPQRDCPRRRRECHLILVRPRPGRRDPGRDLPVANVAGARLGTSRPCWRGAENKYENDDHRRNCLSHIRLPSRTALRWLYAGWPVTWRGRRCSRFATGSDLIPSARQGYCPETAVAPAPSKTMTSQGTPHDGFSGQPPASGEARMNNPS